jgi:homoserine dehydrogenase
MQLRVALLGFGHVGRALAELLLAKGATLRDQHGIIVRVVGISTGSHGHAIDSDGISLRAAIDTVRHNMRLDSLHRGRQLANTGDFLAECPANLIFESIPTSPSNGEPALTYARHILSGATHLVTANKGPVAFGFHELNALAAEKGVGFFFESSVMDGAPVLAVGREGLPATQVNRVQGIFNSTTNYMLTRMEEDDLEFDEALAAAQSIGIAETDPSLDVDGWDSAIKTAILANVIMGADLRPADVDRRGIRDVTREDVRSDRAAGKKLRLLCEAIRAEDGSVTARVAPRHIPAADPLAGIRGTTSIVDFETDVLSRLTIVEHDPGPKTTAYGMLADMINIARGRHLPGYSRLEPHQTV